MVYFSGLRYPSITVATDSLKYVSCSAFMAPELIIGSDKSGRAADIWSLGCVLIEMATGKVITLVIMVRVYKFFT